MARRPMRPLAVLRGLRTKYSKLQTPLTYSSPWQLLVAVILSAQCTDARVNTVTPVLFRKYPTVEKMANAPLAAIEKIIYPTGFYRAKARSLKRASQAILVEHQGKVPSTMQELVSIPGVGRKTANVVLHAIHQKAEGIVVDTHIYRVSLRTGASSASSAAGVERELMKALPKKYWIEYGELAIQHGRKICHARKPECALCPLKQTCPSSNTKDL